MKRFTAQYVFTLTGEPLRNGFVEVEDDGRVVRVGKCAEGSRWRKESLRPAL